MRNSQGPAVRCESTISDPESVDHDLGDAEPELARALGHGRRERRGHTPDDAAAIRAATAPAVRSLLVGSAAVVRRLDLEAGKPKGVAGTAGDPVLDEVELRDGAVAVELEREEREGDLGRAGPFADADHSEHVGEPLLLKGFAVDPPARPGVA